MGRKNILKASFILALLALPRLTFSLSAQEMTDSLTLKIYFRQDKTDIDREYYNNGAFLDRFVEEVRDIMTDPSCRLDDIYIRSSASPEGGFLHNKNLSWNRGKALKEYLSSRLLIPDDKFSIDAVGEDWAGLRERVERDNVPDRDAILRILDKHRAFVDGRPEKPDDSPKPALMSLNKGRTWNWLLDNIYPDLRAAGNSIVCRYTRNCEPEPHLRDTVVIVHEYPVPQQQCDSLPREFPPYPYPYQDAKRPKRVRKGPVYRFAVESNLLFDAVAAPNIAVEFPIGKRWSVRAEHMFPWYVLNEDRHAYEILNSGLEARLWLGDRAKRSVLTGPYVGVYGAGVKADIEYKSVGDQMPYTWHAGVSGGWSFPLGRRDNWRLDLGFKLGYLPYTYDHYRRSDVSGLLLYQRSGQGNWIGPTDVHCSIVWMLPMNRKNKNEK